MSTSTLSGNFVSDHVVIAHPTINTQKSVEINRFTSNLPKKPLKALHITEDIYQIPETHATLPATTTEPLAAQELLVTIARFFS
jgi:hypothetical protein